MQFTLGLAFVVTLFFQQLLQGQPPQNPQAPLPPEVFRVGGRVTPPAVLTRVEPEYSEAARTARIQGTVVLEASISEDGIAKVNRVVRSLGAGLDENAIKAIETWR